VNTFHGSLGFMNRPDLFTDWMLWKTSGVLTFILWHYIFHFISALWLSYVQFFYFYEEKGRAS